MQRSSRLRSSAQGKVCLAVAATVCGSLSGLFSFSILARNGVSQTRMQTDRTKNHTAVVSAAAAHDLSLRLTEMHTVAEEMKPADCGEATGRMTVSQSCSISPSNIEADDDDDEDQARNSCFPRRDHSVDTKAGSGGVRWYEFRLDRNHQPKLYQQGTYAPDGRYRWMGSIDMDGKGNIGMGYSYGGAPEFAGQRFAARMAKDHKGEMTLHETMLAEGSAAQTNTLRWEDYSTTAMDPSDDCTFWYVGDYLKVAGASYRTRIGAFRLPGCGTKGH